MELHELTALQLGEKIRAGEVSPAVSYTHLTLPTNSRV